ncbi:aminomuconate-semialdehyde/2-hydroxymuconate-6-semialdehyde dehydrogenase [Sinobacterium caligoides]|uniref:Aminomuconate-semialdehyde/2-hydroxymuconate-6-semialdehyde dehydrogenase n=1 Tax=Sinobacterium caligoides TaxID=933926 RepID=A0A3N2DPE7_9GAMM|nr:2-hydroxymuconic semialdehyde dehydrogenase [Sinobacterium caligoides]ROS01688.1 aminomuconate-semialdehyde/2-hydroxymuconate-6-semialdehyde dehydrogenase [Sinobacterium caligoides]
MTAITTGKTPRKTPHFGGVLNNYVGGEFVASDKRFANINPVDGSEINQVAEASAEVVDRAVEAARAAVEGEWGKMSVAHRSALLHKVADGIEARFDDFVAAEMADTGKSLWQAENIDIPRGAANFRVFADMASSRAGECFQTETADGQQALNYAVNKPLGVVAVIAPWNLPLLLLTWKLAPAMAVGNAVIAKPSEDTPATATLLAEVMHEAGIPAGAFNLVHGFGPDSAGEFLSKHSGIDAVTFTGESRTGGAIMRAAADNVKALSFELGGKNAAIIFADADFDAAVEGTAKSVFTNGGQVCLCTERVYVEREIYPQFVAALKQKAEALRIDWPEDESTDMGPLISHEHQQKVLSYYQLAKDEGATVVTGGGVPRFGDRRDDGAFVQPTILIGLPETARCIKEEVFGPICHIAPFDREEEAVAMANDSDYGLAATVWTSNLSRAHRIAPQLEVGIVWVNSWYLRDLRTPFGGVKLSGVGREGGVHSLNFYSEPMNICIKLN